MVWLVGCVGGDSGQRAWARRVEGRRARVIDFLIVACGVWSVRSLLVEKKNTPSTLQHPHSIQHAALVLSLRTPATLSTVSPLSPAPNTPLHGSESGRLGRLSDRRLLADRAGALCSQPRTNAFGMELMLAVQDH